MNHMHEQKDAHLTDEKVHSVVHENLNLFTKFALDGRFAQARKIRRRLADSTGNERSALGGDFLGDVTSCLIDTLTLHVKIEHQQSTQRGSTRDVIVT